MYWIGYDIGSSSVKAALVHAESGSIKATTFYPEREMEIVSPKTGWGEQHPNTWWENTRHATRKLLHEASVSARDVKGVGLSYQMHGLVVVDQDFDVIRPAIIWCDSRAVDTGNALYERAGPEKCILRLLNNPGNFTLSKLKWVQENEPEVYAKVHKFMLPGDYVGYKLTGVCCTTPSGLSEAIAYDFTDDAPATWLFEAAGVDPRFIPEIRGTFSEQGRVTEQAAAQTGLPAGIPLMYRAGDQPNNALALNVLEPGEIAATGGTSGVVYAVSDEAATREGTRINCFAHVNHAKGNKRIGKMLCINGTGIQYSWLRKQAGAGLSYDEMNQLAATVPVGADGLRILPFGNGAERMLHNQSKGAQILNVDFNRHQQRHLFRAALEGIAFAFVKGIDILKNDGANLHAIRAGNDNLFRADIFADTLATLTGCRIDIIDTNGAVGAARAAALAFGDFNDSDEATATDRAVAVFKPQIDTSAYRRAYEAWTEELNNYYAFLG
ncbi:MAG: FGGY family carbohydrate kinase [Catalinimonas sp.]